MLIILPNLHVLSNLCLTMGCKDQKYVITAKIDIFKIGDIFGEWKRIITERNILTQQSILDPVIWILVIMSMRVPSKDLGKVYLWTYKILFLGISVWFHKNFMLLNSDIHKAILTKYLLVLIFVKQHRQNFVSKNVLDWQNVSHMEYSLWKVEINQIL